jgi:hypothetical protein
VRTGGDPFSHPSGSSALKRPIFLNLNFEPKGAGRQLLDVGWLIRVDILEIIDPPKGLLGFTVWQQHRQPILRVQLEQPLKISPQGGVRPGLKVST